MRETNRFFSEIHLLGIFSGKMTRIAIISSLVVLAILYCAAASFALNIKPLLSLPETTQAAGEETVLGLYFINELPQVVELLLPKKLSVVLEDEAGQLVSLTVRSLKKKSMISLPPGGYFKNDYRFRLPSEINGKVWITVREFEGMRGVLQVSPGPSGPETVKSSRPVDLAEENPTLGTLFTLYQPYVANISAYEPIYFLVGTDPENSTFQLSMKYRLLNPEGTFSSRYPWLQGFHFSYTQTSFWDLGSRSAPFEDTSYKPELFFLAKNASWRPSWIQGLFFQFGVQHESNGRGGNASRSTNTAYGKPIMILFHQKTRIGIQFTPKFHFYFNNNDLTNPDLADYRGYVSLETKIGKTDSVVMVTNLRVAEKGVSLQTDLSYPVARLLGQNFNTYFQIQYADVLAESLIDYSSRRRSLRVGLAVVR